MSLCSSTPASPVRLSPIPSEDFDQLRDFAEPIWKEAYLGIISLDQIHFMLERGYQAATMIREVEEDGVQYFWIRANEENSGFLAFEPDSSNQSAFLHKFYLALHCHGTGIAAKGMEQLAAILLDQGVQVLHLRVNRNNKRAIRFYQKCGFTITGEDCLPIGNGFVMDDFLMSWSLQ